MSDPVCVLCGGGELRPTRAGLRACAACGLAGAYPIPSEDELRALYTEDYYEAWGDAGGKDPTVGRMKRATFAPRLDLIGPLPAGARVLDVGCATGHFLDLVTERGGEAWGVEISPYAAGVAGERHPDRVHAGTLAEAAYPDAHFHAVFMSDLIEHVPEPLTLLDEVRRILTPGGHVVICTPDFGSPSARLLGRRWYHRKTEHVIYFTGRTLIAALERAGFRDTRTRAGSKTMTIAYLASHFRRYRLFGVTWTLNGLERVLGRQADRPVRLPSAEVVAHARKA